MSDKQKHTYWMNCIKRAKKMRPEDRWKEASDRLNCRKSDSNRGKPYVNGYRLLYESLKSFIDQINPSFQVEPSEVYREDPVALAQAKCDSVYLKYVWDEQKCQIAQSRKLDSALQRNIGYTIVGFDKKKWMPNIKYLSACDVFLDPDCGELLERCKWMGYQEDVSIEELKSRYELNEEELKRVRKSAGSVLSDEEQTDINPEDARLFAVVTLYHVYAKDDAAVRKTTDNEDEMPAKDILEELDMKTYRKYLCFCKGLDRPLAETDWQFDLDDNEFPITPMRFNTPSDNLYGYTDYEQMERLDVMCDNIFSDIETSSYWAGVKKFAGGPDADGVTESTINDFLWNPKRTYLSNFLDANGNPKIQEIKISLSDNDLVNKYQMATDERKVASALGELLSSDATQYKDVTAIAARLHYDNAHQRVNRRLSGPEGYEMSIAEDAIKLVEIAHQFVPRYSLLEVVGVSEETGEEEKQYQSIPWEEAQRLLMSPGTKLIKLGVDAIVGEELAQAWRTTDEVPVRVFKLATKVKVLPGSTRSITQEQQASMLKQYYLEVFFPLYQFTGAWDKAMLFIQRIGQLAGIDKIEDMLPTPEQLQKAQQLQEQQQQQESAPQGMPGTSPPDMASQMPNELTNEGM